MINSKMLRWSKCIYFLSLGRIQFPECRNFITLINMKIIDNNNFGQNCFCSFSMSCGVTHCFLFDFSWILFHILYWWKAPLFRLFSKLSTLMVEWTLNIEVTIISERKRTLKNQIDETKWIYEMNEKSKISMIFRSKKHVKCEHIGCFEWKKFGKAFNP